MIQEELNVLARDVVDNFKSDEYFHWIYKGDATKDVAAFARSVVNMALEEAAVKVEELEQRQMRDGSAAAMVRAMKVK